MNIEHLNPPGLPRNPAYSQAVAVDGPHRVVYVGGQNAVDEAGNVVGIGDARAQAQQVFRNLGLVLAAAGADLGNIVKWNIYYTEATAVRAGYEAFLAAWQGRPNPPAITGVQVVSLARPGLLMEVEAVAIVPAGAGARP
jgi:enamine deaminase RidA (YjgF/YER057c/UK114 family)